MIRTHTSEGTTCANHPYSTSVRGRNQERLWSNRKEAGMLRELNVAFGLHAILPKYEPLAVAMQSSVNLHTRTTHLAQKCAAQGNFLILVQLSGTLLSILCYFTFILIITMGYAHISHFDLS